MAMKHKRGESIQLIAGHPAIQSGHEQPNDCVLQLEFGKMSWFAMFVHLFVKRMRILARS